MNLEEVLKRIREARDKYDTLKLSLVPDQMEILRELSVCYSFLSDFRIDAKEEHNNFYFQSNGKSHASKEREADKQCPELYLIRRSMESTKVLIEAVRSTLSGAKNA